VTRQYQTDTWRLDPQVDAAVWSPVITEGDSVGGHAYSGSIYDAGRDRMVIFGGVRQIETGGAFIDPSNDILTLEFGEGNRWTVARTDLPFDVRASYPSCLYDVAHDRMVVFSRYHGLSALSLEDLSTWIDIDEQRPNFSPVAVVSSGSLAVSIGSDRIVRKFSISQFSGYEALGPERDGLGVKKGVHPGGPTFPQGKDGSLLYWGGFFAIEGEAERDLWRFSPDVEPHWSHSLLAGGLPHPRSDAAFAYDGRRHRWWMYGGYSRDTVGTYLADVWSFDPIKLHWERFDLPAGPGSRYGAGLAYDGFRDRLVLFGGADAGAQYARDTWALPLSGDMRWIALSTSVRVPQGRAFSALVCEPDRDRLVLAGGVRWTSSPIFFARRFRDTWTFDLETGTWDSLATQPAVPLNEHEQFAWYDVARGLVNTFGGEGLNGSTFRTGSLRAFDDEALGWKYAPDSDGAPGSTLAPALDPERDRFYVFNEADLGEGWVLQRNHPTHRVFLESAGRNGQGPETIVLLGDPLFDVSALDVGSVTLAGARARGNSDGGPTRDFNGDGYIDRILRFDRSDLRLDPASKTARFEGRSRDGVALVGFLPRTVFSSTTTASGDPDSPHDTVRPLSLFALGFERREGTLRLDLPSRERVRLEIYGVNGRRVEGRDLGMLEAGQHDLPEFGLAGKTAGIYFVRATVGTQATQTRLVWIP
jgi:hypothetical protein